MIFSRLPKEIKNSIMEYIEGWKHNKIAGWYHPPELLIELKAFENPDQSTWYRHCLCLKTRQMPCKKCRRGIDLFFDFTRKLMYLSWHSLCKFNEYCYDEFDIWDFIIDDVSGDLNNEVWEYFDFYLSFFTRVKRQELLNHFPRIRKYFASIADHKFDDWRVFWNNIIGDLIGDRFNELYPDNFASIISDYNIDDLRKNREPWNYIMAFGRRFNELYPDTRIHKAPSAPGVEF